MSAQRRVNDLSYSDNDYLSQLDKYFNEQSKSNSNLSDSGGILGRAKKALEKLNDGGVLYSQSIGPEESSFRATIITNNLEKNPDKKKNEALIEEAMDYWIKFTEAVSALGNNGGKAFIQINEGRAIIDFSINTEDLLSNLWDFLFS